MRIPRDRRRRLVGRGTTATTTAANTNRERHVSAKSSREREDRWFEIAERDLMLRGPGDLFGTRQAGAPTFRVIDLVRDREWLDTARREAVDWLASSPPTRDAMAKILEGWRDRFQLIEIG